MPRPPLTAAAAAALTAPRRRRSGFFFDFDGTLATIQDEPAGVRPVPGAVAVLARLAPAVGRLAIVSARPAAFLHERFHEVPGIVLHGLYGLERATADGGTVTAPEAIPWLAVVREVAARARRELPPAVLVEDKRLSVALHYRTAPLERRAVEEWARARRASHGLVAQEGRMVVELRPPVGRDKGDVLRDEVRALECAWHFGDDLSDLAAFAALAERERAGDGFVGVRAAVANPETGGPLREAADFVVEGPEAVPALLSEVAAALTAGAAPARPGGPGPAPGPSLSCEVP